MGKWTVDYADLVLDAKLKRLVAGAIRRLQLEKAEPLITNEAFIQELDEGDGFTASLFDILVKEVAERRARDNPFNRHMISEQTAISLRALAAPTRVYRDRARIPRRRSSNYTLAEYLAGVPDQITVEDDEEGDFDMMMDGGASAVEGTRVNTELYDAYAPPSAYSAYEPVFSASTRRPRLDHSTTTTSTVGDGTSERFFPETLLSRSPPSSYSQIRTESHTVTQPRSAPSPSHSSILNRPPPVRRPLRSTRATDFNDFTSRRRVSRRNSVEAVDHPSEQLTVPHARRFFSSSRRRPEVLTASHTPAHDAHHSEDASWMMLRPIDVHSTTPSESQNGGTVRAPHPPLRRGTVRAPESVLPHVVRRETEISPGHTPGQGDTDTPPNHLNHENALHLLEMVAERRDSAQFI